MRPDGKLEGRMRRPRSPGLRREGPQFPCSDLQVSIGARGVRSDRL